MTNRVPRIFKYLLAIWIFHFVKCICNVLPSFLLGYLSFSYWFWLFTYFECKSSVIKYFLPHCGLPFLLSSLCFWWTDSLNFNVVLYIYCFLYSSNFLCPEWEIFVYHKSWNYSLFLSWSFHVLLFTDQQCIWNLFMCMMWDNSSDSLFSTWISNWLSMLRDRCLFTTPMCCHKPNFNLLCRFLFLCSMLFFSVPLVYLFIAIPILYFLNYHSFIINLVLS